MVVKTFQLLRDVGELKHVAGNDVRGASFTVRLNIEKAIVLVGL